MDALLNTFLDFKELLIIGIAFGCVFFVLSSIVAGNITWKSRSLRFVGIFVGMNVREMLWFSVGMVRILFIITVCIFAPRLTVAHLAYFVALFLLSAFTFPKISRILLELISTAGIYVVLIVLGILLGYYNDINSDPLIIAIYVLLSLFAVFYSIYFFMRGISDLIFAKLGLEEWKVVRK